MATMYELTNQYNELYMLFTNGEIEEDTLCDTLESIDWETEFEGKVENYVKVLKQIEADGEVLKAEETRLKERRNAFEGNARRLKETLYNAMKVTGNQKIKTPLFGLNIQKNPPSVEIGDSATIPPEYLIEQVPKVDKKALMSALKEGKAFEGITLCQGESLRIR